MGARVWAHGESVAEEDEGAGAVAEWMVDGGQKVEDVMTALYADGRELYTTRAISGSPIVTGDLVTIVESYSEKGAETRYLIQRGAKNSGIGFSRWYVYESDLSERDPLMDEP